MSRKSEYDTWVQRDECELTSAKGWAWTDDWEETSTNEVEILWKWGQQYIKKQIHTPLQVKERHNPFKVHLDHAQHHQPLAKYRSSSQSLHPCKSSKQMVTYKRLHLWDLKVLCWRRWRGIVMVLVNRNIVSVRGIYTCESIMAKLNVASAWNVNVNKVNWHDGVYAYLVLCFP
jgi:hypothetical protein